MSLKNKVVILTGGSGGLGRKMAMALCKEKTKLIICYHKNKKQIENILSAADYEEYSAYAMQLDVRNPVSIGNVISKCMELHGTVDILINAAGVTQSGMSWKLEEKFWHSTLDVNLTGTFLSCKAVLPIMREKKWGRIINISSVVGQVGVVGTCAYAASKAGIIGLTKTIAVEVAANGITANTIALGYFEDGMINSIPPDKLKKILLSIPVHRLGKSNEVIHTIKFLCSDEASYITGQTINVNGGLYA